MSVLETDVEENRLMRRKEVRAKIGYESRPPTRKEVVNILAGHLNVPAENIVTVKVENITGMRAMRIHAHAYDDISHAKRFERPYILRRCGLIS
ncbi:MAG: hypothetical protein QW756_01610 [Nitrososphaerota archaeon]